MVPKRYRKLGFQDRGHTQRLLLDTNEDAIIMWKDDLGPDSPQEDKSSGCYSGRVNVVLAFPLPWPWLQDVSVIRIGVTFVGENNALEEVTTAPVPSG